MSAINSTWLCNCVSTADAIELDSWQGATQQEAINEIATLPQGNPDRQKVLKLFMSIKHNSGTRPDFD
jgi:hypothetical protein